MSTLRFDFLNLDYSKCPPSKKPALFGFTCPNGKGQCTGLHLRAGPHTAANTFQPADRTWIWNGDREKPTFSPSINCKVGNATCWHGWIKDGKLVK